MSLADMNTDTSDCLSADDLHNAALNNVTSGLQAIGWEPIGRTGTGEQLMAKGNRTFAVRITVLDDGIPVTVFPA